MRRIDAIGIGGAAALLAGALAAAVYADEPQRDAHRPRRMEFTRILNGGGRLGVELRDVESGDRGATVARVEEGSAADKAGIKEGDVIVRFAGEDVRSAAQLARVVRETPPGRTVNVEVTRGGAAQTVSVTLAKPDHDHVFGPGMAGDDFFFEMPAPPDMADFPEAPAPPHPPMPPMAFGARGGRKLGLAYQELGDQLARYFKVEGGVLVTDVDEDGPAGKAGIKAGDVIVRIGGKTVRDGSDVREALRDVEPGSTATIGVQREGRAMDLSVKVGAMTPPRRREG
jgi:serine protease Do